MAIDPKKIREEINKKKASGGTTAGRSQIDVYGRNTETPTTTQTSDIKQSQLLGGFSEAGNMAGQPKQGETGQQFIRRTALSTAETQKRRGGLGIRRPMEAENLQQGTEAINQLAQKQFEQKPAIPTRDGAPEPTPIEEIEQVEKPPLSEAEQLIEEGQSIQDKARKQLDQAEQRQVSMSEIAKEQSFIQKQANKDLQNVQLRQRELEDTERRKEAAKDEEERKLIELQKAEKLAGVDKLMTENDNLSYAAASQIYDAQQKQIAEGFLDKSQTDVFNEILSNNPDAKPEDLWDAAINQTGGDIEKASKLFGTRFSPNLTDKMKTQQYIDNGEDPETAKILTEIEKADRIQQKILSGEISGGIDGKRQFYTMMSTNEKNDPNGLIRSAVLDNIIESNADPEMKSLARTEKAMIEAEQVLKRNKNADQYDKMEFGGSMYAINKNNPLDFIKLMDAPPKPGEFKVEGNMEDGFVKFMPDGSQEFVETPLSMKKLLTEGEDEFTTDQLNYFMQAVELSGGMGAGISDEDIALKKQKFLNNVKESGLDKAYAIEMGFNIADEDDEDFGRVMRKYATFGGKRAVNFGITELINNGNREQAVQKMEEMVLGEDYAQATTESMALLQNASNVRSLIDEYGDEAMGWIDAGLLEGKKMIGLDTESMQKAQKLKASMTAMVMELRKRISGSAVTVEESKFLEPLLAELSDQPGIAIQKINALEDLEVNTINSMRFQKAMPKLTIDEILDSKKKLQKYESEYVPEMKVEERKLKWGKPEQIEGATSINLIEDQVTQTEPVKKNPDGSVSFGKANTQRASGRQCGGFVNDILGLKNTNYPMGDTLASKMRNPKFKKIDAGGAPVAGGYFVSDPLGLGDTPDNPGHTGLIKEVTPLGIVIEDYNRLGKQERRISFVPYDSEEYKTFQGFGQS